MYLSGISAKGVVATPLEAGTPAVVICRDKFVAHKIALTRMESSIWALHDLPELYEPYEPSLSKLVRLGNGRAELDFDSAWARA